jgi:hypothetical protein
VPFRNRGPHFELIGRTPGGLFAICLREVSNPDRALVRSGSCDQDSASTAHYCRDEGDLRRASRPSKPCSADARAVGAS